MAVYYTRQKQLRLKRQKHFLNVIAAIKKNDAEKKD